MSNPIHCHANRSHIPPYQLSRTVICLSYSLVILSLFVVQDVPDEPGGFCYVINELLLSLEMSLLL